VQVQVIPEGHDPGAAQASGDVRPAEAGAGLRHHGLGQVGPEQAAEVGKRLAASAKQAGVEACVFDRAGYLYHGRVKSLADGAREGGLKF